MWYFYFIFSHERTYDYITRPLYTIYDAAFSIFNTSKLYTLKGGDLKYNSLGKGPFNNLVIIVV